MKLYIFGSCGGTEPMEGRHHTSFALAYADRLYWFDAGEGCSYTAHQMGVDLLKVSDIYISHSHMDHVGGLPNLLWTIRKLSMVKKEQPAAGAIRVHIPNADMWDGVRKLLIHSEDGYKNDYPTEAHTITPGILTDADIRVSAYPNAHLPPLDGVPQSFSFRIAAGGKTIVYSGDIKAYEELQPLLDGGCDILLIETGHHSPIDICDKAERDGHIGKLYFLHHGRQILYHHDELLAEARQHFHGEVVFCRDGDTFALR